MEGMSGDLYNAVVDFLKEYLKGGDSPSYLFLAPCCMYSYRAVSGFRCLRRIVSSLEFSLAELGMPEQKGPGGYHGQYLLPLSELEDSTIKTGLDVRSLLSFQC